MATLQLLQFERLTLVSIHRAAWYSKLQTRSRDLYTSRPNAGLWMLCLSRWRHSSRRVLLPRDHMLRSHARRLGIQDQVDPIELPTLPSQAGRDRCVSLLFCLFELISTVTYGHLLFSLETLDLLEISVNTGLLTTVLQLTARRMARQIGRAHV